MKFYLDHMYYDHSITITKSPNNISIVYSYVVLLNFVMVYLVLIKMGPKLPTAVHIKTRITKVNSQNSIKKSIFYLVILHKHTFPRNEQTRYNSYYYLLLFNDSRTLQ